MNPGDLAIVDIEPGISVESVGRAGTTLYNVSDIFMQIVGWLPAQTTVLVLSDNRVNNKQFDKFYVLVLTQSCDVGWVMESRLRKLL
jgi:hypothetical protein